MLGSEATLEKLIEMLEAIGCYEGAQICREQGMCVCKFMLCKGEVSLVCMCVCVCVCVCVCTGVATLKSLSLNVA